MITEDYVSFETAKLLKEKGFDEKISMIYMSYGELRKLKRYDGICNSNYNDITKNYFEFTALTLQMAMKWLREVHLLHISIDMVNGGRWEYEIDDISVPFDGGILLKYYCDKSFSSYEEAVDDAIKHCLEHLI